MKDIENRKDIELLINTFYERVKEDEVIGYIFNDIARVNWPQHLPIMYDFWENIVLDTGGYTRNVMEPHLRLNAMVRLLPEHFERWLNLFENTVQDLFAGDKANMAIARARSIKGIMELKVGRLNKGEL